MLPTPNTLDMARRLPNNELVIYPDAGHGGIFQFHEQFVEKALEFPREVAPRRRWASTSQRSSPRHRPRSPSRSRRASCGAEVVLEPTEQRYGIRDGAVCDPTANLVRMNQLP